jgi:maltose alpha-D-glucosyltransferase/alpha-amylase
MGDNHYLGDRHGVRTPMQWSSDRNAGFSNANPQRLYSQAIIDPLFHFYHVNVETEEQNTSSILWWMKEAIAVRKEQRAFGMGELRIVHSSNHKILSFLRTLEEETILVAINLSRFAQESIFELDDFDGYDAIEIFSQNKFSQITKNYPLSFSPYSYYWLKLKKSEIHSFCFEKKSINSNYKTHLKNC